ncbi:MAG: HAD hydrolase-like protein [Kofleriaceae bacterium]
MPARLAIFDFDGTLADSWPWFTGVLDDAAIKYRFRRIDASEAQRLRGCTTREILRALEVSWWKLPMIASYARKRAAAEVERITLFPGAAEVLREASRAGITLAIVSSNQESTIRRVLGPELAMLVAQYGCGASLFGKPAKLRQVLRQSRHAASDAIAIGDEVRDLEAAREVGVASGAVAWGYATVDALRRSTPTRMFTSFDELRGFLVSGLAG